MSLTMAIFMLVSMWLTIAAAMLWGVLRIVRRRHHLHHCPPRAIQDLSATGRRRPMEAQAFHRPGQATK